MALDHGRLGLENKFLENKSKINHSWLNTFQRHSVSKTLAQREPFFFPTSFSIYIEFDRH